MIITIGILVALSVGVSLNLTSIAVIFTALSVGIGFGLQYIAADIASGFILLFERPVRVGDRISIGNQEGDVQSINLRTTVLMTNDRVSVIVPNSKLVRDQLINWSYGDPRARIAIPIGVLSAARQDTWADYAARSAAIGLLAIPGFWLGTLAVTLPSVWWQWTPPLRRSTAARALRCAVSLPRVVASCC